MAADIGAIFAGFVLLFLGGEGLVRGSVGIAERFGLSKLLIGLTVVAFGTSAPELVVAVDAALSGAPEIALGNVVGSNIANILLILGIAISVAPIAIRGRAGLRDSMIAGLASLILFGLVLGDVIDRIEGGILLLILAIYLAASYLRERRGKGPSIPEQGADEFTTARPQSLRFLALLVVGGVVALVVGAEFLVSGSVSIARSLGVSDAVIGLSLVAIGTSLPELATAVVAAYRRHADVVLGNVIGSSIFNILAILGITSLIQPVAVADRFREFDVPVMMGASAILIFILFAAKGMGRATGAAMLIAYTAYMIILFVQ
jgi:cation:H+ antiporter